jgi:hypothetical protein
MGKPEGKIEEYLRDKVKALEGKAYKFISPGNNGVPDRLICLPGGLNFFIELKAPGKTSTPQQLNRQRELKKLGNYVDVIYTKDKVDQFIGYCELCISLGSIIPLVNTQETSST